MRVLRSVKTVDGWTIEAELRDEHHHLISLEDGVTQTEDVSPVLQDHGFVLRGCEAQDLVLGGHPDIC